MGKFGKFGKFGRAASALAVAGLVVFSPARAMEESNAIVTIDELCVLMACRPAREIVMRRGPGEPDIVIQTKKSPHVFQGIVTLVSGESNPYVIDVREGAIRDIRLWHDVGDAARLSIALDQPAELADGASELRVTNSLPWPLTLRLDALRPARKEPEPTRVCAVAADSLFKLRFNYPVHQVVIDLDLAAGQTLADHCQAN